MQEDTRIYQQMEIENNCNPNVAPSAEAKAVKRTARPRTAPGISNATPSGKRSKQQGETTSRTPLGAKTPTQIKPMRTPKSIQSQTTGYL